MSCDNFDKFSEEVDTINNNSEVPVWAKVLIGCFKNFINEIKSISVQQLAIISQLEDKSKVQKIVKFVNLRKRLEVFRSKRYLKGSNIIITENLTKKRYDLYREAMTKLGKGNVWTSDGKILSKSGNSIIVISSPDDLKS